MKRLLVVSPLDVLGSPNSRTHHLVRHLSFQFQETIAISRNNITRKPFRYKLAALFRLRTEVLTEGKIRWVAMTHWGSIRQGLGLFLLGLTNPYVVPKWGVRRILRRTLSFLGIFFEFGILPSLVFTFMTRIRIHVDVFIGEGPWEVALGILLRNLGWARLVVYDDIDYAPGFQPISNLRKRFMAILERLTIRHADLIISVSNRLAHLRREQGAHNVFVVPNGVDWGKFASANMMENKKYMIPPTLIYIGYLGAWAGVDLILNAVAMASKRISGLRLILLGHGTPEELSELRDRMFSLGLNDIVSLRGEVSYEELPKHLAEAVIGMAMFRPLDLTRYAFPLKVIEYMAAGLPVLTTDDTEAANLVKQADAGMVLPFDTKAVADAISEILMDTERYRQYSNNAKSFSKSYDWARLFENYYSVIRDPYEFKLKHQEID